MFRRFALFLSIVAVMLSVMLCQQALLAEPAVQDRPVHHRLVGPQTLSFAQTRMSDILQSPVVKSLFEQMPEMKVRMERDFEKQMGFTPDSIETINVYVDSPRFEAGRVEELRPPYLVFQAKKPLNTVLVKSTITPNGKSAQVGKYGVNYNETKALIFLDQKTFLMIEHDGRINDETLKEECGRYTKLIDSPVDVPAGLKSGLELMADKKHHIVAAVQISDELSSFVQEQIKELPPTMAPFKPLAKLKSVIVTMDYVADAENDVQVKLRGRFENADQAKAGSGAVRFAIAAGKLAISSMPIKDAELKQLNEILKKQLDQVKVNLSDAEVVVDYVANTRQLLPMISAATNKVRLAADRMVSANNLRQLMIAMHNYHADNGKLPEAIVMKNSKPMHSWRVLMLPYLEEDRLYKQINMDEPWDSVANKKLFESVPMPKVFAHPSKQDGENKKTYYKTFISKADAKVHSGFVLGKPLTLGRITVMDGTSNTVALVEAGPPVIWYKPEEIEFDANGQLPKMTSPWKTKQINVAFFDASVRQFWLDTDEATWKGLITVNGGETVDTSKVEEQK